MNTATIAVHWHDENQPVYLVCFQPVPGCARSSRLVTGGGDKNVRIWKVNYSDAKEPQFSTVEYLSTLRKHTQAVNAVRFDPKGEILATAGDDGLLILWTLSEHIVHEFGHNDNDLKESWVVKQIHNTGLEIYDILWLPDLKHIATGSMDNITKIYNVQTGQKLAELADHSHYIQGVSWDPHNEYLATQSADRSLHIYLLKRSESAVLVLPTLFFKIVRADVPVAKIGSGISLTSRLETILLSTESSPRADHSMQPPVHNYVHHVVSLPPRKSLSSESLPAVKPGNTRRKKSSMLYHSETLQSFFRRLAFSPDGSLLLTPLGIFKNDDNDDEGTSEHLNTVYIYIRSGLNKPPVCHIPGLAKPAVAIAFSPVRYRVSDDQDQTFRLPYKMVFAVATQDCIVIYDTQHLCPLGLLSNMHYSTITDLCWDGDGLCIMVSSAEGFCSVVMFESGIFGEIYHAPQIETTFKGGSTATDAKIAYWQPALTPKGGNDGPKTEEGKQAELKAKSESPRAKLSPQNAELLSEIDDAMRLKISEEIIVGEPGIPRHIKTHPDVLDDNMHQAQKPAAVHVAASCPETHKAQIGQESEVTDAANAEVPQVLQLHEYGSEPSHQQFDGIGRMQESSGDTSKISLDNDEIVAPPMGSSLISQFMAKPVEIAQEEELQAKKRRITPTLVSNPPTDKGDNS